MKNDASPCFEPHAGIPTSRHAVLQVLDEDAVRVGDVEVAGMIALATSADDDGGFVLLRLVVTPNPLCEHVNTLERAGWKYLGFIHR